MYPSPLDPSQRGGHRVKQRPQRVLRIRNCGSVIAAKVQQIISHSHAAGKLKKEEKIISREERSSRQPICVPLLCRLYKSIGNEASTGMMLLGTRDYPLCVVYPINCTPIPSPI